MIACLLRRLSSTSSEVTYPYDSCRLLALNLLSYVDNPFKKDAKFNFDKFRSHVAMAMRMICLLYTSRCV